MNKRIRRITALITVSVLGVGFGSGILAQKGQRNHLDPFRRPDEFAWNAFASISFPAVHDGSSTVFWETWADDQQVYDDPIHTPKWPTKKSHNMRFQRSMKMQPLFGTTTFKSKDVPRSIPLSITPSTQLNSHASQFFIPPDAAHPTEVRMNYPTFKYIVDNNLWYIEGQEAAVKKGIDLCFPKPSKEIKAMWKVITKDQEWKYHWQKAPDGTIYGLVGLHITTKDIPNWFWATFEHMDNPDLGKELPYVDQFGLRNKQITPELARLFRRFNLDPKWRFYRLTGTQTQFFDKHGNPTLCGNSVIEGVKPRDFLGSSSCISCHQQSAISASGNQLGFFRSSDPTGYVGISNPAWLKGSNGKRIYLKRDFVWSLGQADTRVKPPPPLPKVSFAHDILPLFSAPDIQCMKPRVLLDDYAFMSNPTNANMVLGRLKGTSGAVMPPNNPWSPAKMSLFVKWMSDGFNP